MKRNTEKIRLIAPSQEMKNHVMDFRAEFLERGEKIPGSGGLQRYENFEDWLEAVRANQLDKPADWVLSTTFFAVRLSDGVLVGITNIRHWLNESIYHNGHIGYAVRPAERRKGYGTEILRQALIKAEQLGVLETVVTCNKGNTASRRVIENNNLQYERSFLEDNGNTVLIYTASR